MSFVFRAFVAALPVHKQITQVIKCRGCACEMERYAVAVNGFTEWAYRDVPDGGEKVDRMVCPACLGKPRAPWVPPVTTLRGVSVARVTGQVTSCVDGPLDLDW